MLLTVFILSAPDCAGLRVSPTSALVKKRGLGRLFVQSAVAFTGIFIHLCSSMAQEPPPLDPLVVAPGVLFLRQNDPTANPSTVIVHGTRGILVVDPGFQNVVPRLVSIMDSLAADSVPRFVIATHSHPDHMEGFAALRGVAVGLATPQSLRRLASADLGDGATLAADALPQVVFQDSLIVDLGGIHARLFPPPLPCGHTDGDLFVYIPEARVLCAGDFFFANRLPIVDSDLGGSLAGYLGSIRMLGTMLPAETIVIPGHGTFAPEAVRTWKLADWVEWSHTIENAATYVRKRLAEGISVEDLSQEEPPEAIATLVVRPRFVKWERWVSFIANEPR